MRNTFALLSTVLLLISLDMIAIRCQDQVPNQPLDTMINLKDTSQIEKIISVAIPETVRRLPDDTYEFFNPVTKSILKRLSPAEMASKSPWWNADYPVLSSANEIGGRYKFLDIRKLPLQDRQDLAKKVQSVPFVGDTSEFSEINFVHIQPNIAYSFRNGIVVKHTVTFCQYDHCKIPSGYQTRFVRYDSTGKINAVWDDYYQFASVSISLDGRFVLTNSTVRAGEAEEIMGEWALIDMNEKKKIPIPRYLKNESGYYTEREVLVRGKYFILPLSGEGNFVWLIIDAYSNSYFDRVFKVTTEKEYMNYSKSLYNEYFFNGNARGQVNFSGFTKHNLK